MCLNNSSANVFDENQQQGHQSDLGRKVYLLILIAHGACLCEGPYGWGI